MDWSRFDQALKAKGWTQDRLAKAMGIQASKISKWKCSDDLWLSELKEIANFLGVSPMWLLGEADPLNPADRGILRAAREMGYDEAIARLTRPASHPHTGGIDPATGAPVPPKRKGAG
jgi:transcriptional regulator with XRE-family HTH domain